MLCLSPLQDAVSGSLEWQHKKGGFSRLCGSVIFIDSTHHCDTGGVALGLPCFFKLQHKNKEWGALRELVSWTTFVVYFTNGKSCRNPASEQLRNNERLTQHGSLVFRNLLRIRFSHDSQNSILCHIWSCCTRNFNLWVLQIFSNVVTLTLHLQIFRNASYCPNKSFKWQKFQATTLKRSYECKTAFLPRLSVAVILILDLNFLEMLNSAPTSLVDW